MSLLFIQIGDLFTTQLVIDNGGVELNPLFNHFQETIWFWPLMTGVKVMFILWVYYSLTTADRYYPLAARVTFLILLGQGIMVIGNNIQVLATIV